MILQMPIHKIAVGSAAEAGNDSYQHFRRTK